VLVRFTPWIQSTRKARQVEAYNGPDAVYKMERVLIKHIFIPEVNWNTKNRRWTKWKWIKWPFNPKISVLQFIRRQVMGQ